eukprot:CAMPEP_0194439372 /NCGR_PEP_ID=MMETSP0176-20130528/110183_1 /TAXON_ID=216777 /ORGANISM="Proboscia alata, Strain PI-D3" /LENGTH=55 /DNA_ID=CAMNT_0039262521 /DNA_START=57 /DNA_END=221 /DNA_ORIENTATION=-
MLPKSKPEKGVKSATLENIQEYDYTPTKSPNGWGYIHYEVCANYENTERYVDGGA